MVECVRGVYIAGERPVYRIWSAHACVEASLAHRVALRSSEAASLPFSVSVSVSNDDAQLSDARLLSATERSPVAALTETVTAGLIRVLSTLLQVPQVLDAIQADGSGAAVAGGASVEELTYLHFLAFTVTVLTRTGPAVEVYDESVVAVMGLLLRYQWPLLKWSDEFRFWQRLDEEEMATIRIKTREQLQPPLIRNVIIPVTLNFPPCFDGEVANPEAPGALAGRPYRIRWQTPALVPDEELTEAEKAARHVLLNPSPVSSATLELFFELSSNAVMPVGEHLWLRQNCSNGKASQHIPYLNKLPDAVHKECVGAAQLLVKSIANK